MAVLFYYDDWAHKDHQINQVRLVKDNNNNTGESSLVIKGFTMSETFNIDVTHSFNKLSGIPWVEKLKGFVQQGREAALMGTAATQNMMNFANNLLGRKSGNAVRDPSEIKEDQDRDAERGAWMDAFERFMGDMNHTMNTKIDYSDAYLYVFDGTDITIPGQFKQILITDSENSDIEEDFKNIVEVLVGDFSTLDESGYVGFTEAPNGFETALDALKGQSPKGTFTMYIGDYRFPGVVVTGISIDVSKTRVKIGNDYKPLYIEIDYTVKPIIKYTKKHLLQWFSSNRGSLPSNLT